MAIPYLGEEWAQRALRVVETDQGLMDALKGTELRLLAIVLDPPEDRYGFFYLAFDASGLQDYRVGHDYHAVTKDIEAPLFVVSGRYDVFAAIQTRKVALKRALLSGQLHLTGPWRKALRQIKAFEALAEALIKITCTT